MRITEAAQRLGTSPRMLRYRDHLGLLPAVRDHPGWQRQAGRESPPAGPVRAAGSPPRARRHPPHRQFGDRDLDAVALALQIERRYDISPAALAFGLRVLADPGARADVAELGRRIGRIPPPARALDFEKERALRLLGLSAKRGGPGQRARPRRTARSGNRRAARTAGSAGFARDGW
jgi:MerR family transcriptional regulator, copper efflux regulator